MGKKNKNTRSTQCKSKLPCMSVLWIPSNWEPLLPAARDVRMLLSHVNTCVLYRLPYTALFPLIIHPGACHNLFNWPHSPLCEGTILLIIWANLLLVHRVAASNYRAAINNRQAGGCNPSRFVSLKGKLWRQVVNVAVKRPVPHTPGSGFDSWLWPATPVDNQCRTQ